jgi:hypothetical protein
MGENNSMNEDWRYSEQKLALREQALRVLFAKYAVDEEGGIPKYSLQSIYECAHDWISQGNINTSGIISYYKAYYS